MSKGYLDENRWFITASKLKYFIEYGPEAYKLKYIDELILPTEEEEPRYYVIGSAFDFLISYGETEFLRKYYIDDGLLKAELAEKLAEKTGKTVAELSKLPLPELRAMYYQEGERIRLTPAEWRDIMGMYRECKRQPNFDFAGEYKKQEVFEASYNGLAIRGKLDRYDPVRGIIRDTKTTGQLNYFEYDMSTTFDYIFSMAFYYCLARVRDDIQCDVVLDVVSKKAPYGYIAYRLNKSDLLLKVQHKVKPALEALKECMNKNVRLSVYPISYDTTDSKGNIISYTQGEPISRTKLMQCEYYGCLEGSIASWFVQPSF